MDEVSCDSPERGESGPKNVGWCEMGWMERFIFSTELSSCLGKCTERKGLKLI